MVKLENYDEAGRKLTATFSPQHGMNLQSYKRDDLEIIDQSTRALFEERSAGLGALIGPHFHHRESIPKDFDSTRFPHIARLKTDEPFSHGISRYAPWEHVYSTTQIQATLFSKMRWNNVLLRDLEGFDFHMNLDVRLLPDGLVYHYRVQSEKPSVIGLHTYYAIDDSSVVKMDIDNTHTSFPLNKAYDDSFHPSLHGAIYRSILETKSHSVHITYLCASNSEFSTQLYRPENASYVCIEPLSAKNPRKPLLCTSNIEIRIEIL